MILYLDTSALIKLYVLEDGSDFMRARVLEAEAVLTAVVAYPEARAALAAMRRGNRLPGATYRQAKAELDAEWPKLTKIGITPALSREAGDFAERFELRGFDAVHLACYAEASRSGGTAIAFLSFDARLSRAAKLWRASR